MSYDEYQGGGLRSISLFGIFVGVAAFGALAFSVLAYTQTHHDRTQVKALQARVAHQLAVLRHRNAALGTKVNSTARQLKKKDGRKKASAGTRHNKALQTGGASLRR